ncbi:MAG: MFS transporter [Holosporaceae bacterium]|nr:MFS transporter [Holosporaceae bacterium]
MIKISKQKKINLAVGSLGNVLSWYSFSLFMPFLPIISKRFFPIEDPALCSTVSFLALSIGLFMRPVGSMIFGPIGDLIGRKKALFLSILFMAVPTVCIGLLPSYNQIGIMSPLLLLVFRACQGVSLGGEYTAAMVHLVESAPAHRRGFFGSWSDVGLQIGVLGSMNSLLLLHCFFSELEIYDFAWRIPFILGIVLIPFAFYFYNENEPAAAPAAIAKEERKESRKVCKIVRELLENKPAVFCTIAVTSFSAVGFYTLFTFLPYHLVREKMLTLKESTFCCACASLAITTTVLGCGYLSDYFRRKPFIIAGIAGVSAVVYAIFLLKINSPFTWTIAYVSYGLFLGMYFSCRSAFFSESFPRKIRCTGVSLSLSLAQAIVGGLTPVIMNYCTFISPIMSIAPATVVGIMAAIAMWEAQDRTGMELL